MRFALTERHSQNHVIGIINSRSLDGLESTQTNRVTVGVPTTQIVRASVKRMYRKADVAKYESDV